MTVQPGKEKTRGGSCPCVHIPYRGGKEDRVRPFSVVPTEKKKGNGHNLQCRIFHLNIREKCFTVKMVEDWNLVVQ